MSAVVKQQPDELDLRVRHPLIAIPEADWHLLSSEGAAVKYALEHMLKPIAADKAIAYDIGTDPTTLSNAKSDSARLAAAVRRNLADRTGVPATLYFECLLHNTDPRTLRPFQSEIERRLQQTEEALEAERVKVRVLTDALRGVTS